MVREIKVPEVPKIASTSYDGRHVLEFNEGSHRYKLDGKAAVGTTTFIKGGYPTSDALIQWMAGQAAAAALAFGRAGDERPDKDIIREARGASRKKSEEAANIGSQVHEYAETGILQPDRDARVDMAVDAFRAWRDKNVDTDIVREQIIASPIYKFCGKFDRLAVRGTRLVLSDYKTSSGIYVEMFLQLAAYRLAIREWLGRNVDALEILRFGKDGEFQTVYIDEPTEIEELTAQVIRCRETYGFRRWEEDERFKYGGVKG